LNEELQLAVANQARVVLLTGELGIGKTRLWQEWSAQLPPNLTVLETRCLDTGRALPFAPLTRLFNQAECIEHLLKPASAIPVVWLAELTRLLPEIRQRRPELPVPPTLPPEEERTHLFEAFTRLLETLASQLLVLIIDDLHWADRTTLDWLVYLLDRMREAPLMLVCSYRRLEAPAHLAQVIANWSREDLVRRLPLNRLTLPEPTQLVTALGGDLSRVEQLQIRSAGNPYFRLELARARPDDTPPGLAELIRARLDRLPQAVQQVLQAAATLETEFDLGLLRRTSGRGEEETLNALDILLAENVLVEQDAGAEKVGPLELRERCSVFYVAMMFPDNPCQAAVGVECEVLDMCWQCRWLLRSATGAIEQVDPVLLVHGFPEGLFP